MKIVKFNVPFYKWKIVSIVAESFDDEEAVLKKMKSLHMREEDIDNIKQKFDIESINGAYIHYNYGALISVIVTFPHKSNKELVSTLVHEGRHAVDAIIESIGLEGVESAAYLEEYVTLKLISDYIKEDETN